MRYLRRLAILSLMLSVLSSILISGVASAAPFPAPFSPPPYDSTRNSFNRWWGSGYFSGQNFNTDASVAICQSRWVWPSGFLYGQNDDGTFKDRFEQRIRNDLFTAWPSPPPPGNPASSANCYTDAANMARIQTASAIVGTALIVNTMLGHQGTEYANYLDGVIAARNSYDEWKAVVDQYAARPGGIDWNAFLDFTSTTRADMAAQLNGYDAGFYGNNQPESSFSYIRFNNPDGTSYVINKKCGNVTGDARGLQVENGDFTITPSAQTPILDDPEDPTQATFRTGVDVNPGPVITDTRRHYYIKRYSGGTVDIATTSVNDYRYPDGPTNYNDTHAVSGLVPGDQICATMRVDDAAGRVDSNGNVTRRTRGPTTSAESCITVVAKPYLRVFGNDVLTGAGLTSSSGSCSLINNKATALTLNRENRSLGGGSNDIFTGSGTQLAAYALGEISQFTSASGNAQRAFDQRLPTAPIGLTFGNYGTPSITKSGTNWDSTGTVVDPSEINGFGGKGSVSHCMPDYYRAVANNPSTTVDSTSTNVTITGQNSIPAAIAYTHANTLVTLNTNATALTGKHVLAVNGNVYITGNGFNYAGYGNVANIPSLYIIASGNIYISPSVDNLAGVYVAQPISGSESSTGIISTCAQRSGSSLFTVAYDNIFNVCNNQLVVRGAFIAEHIKFVRSYGSLKNGRANESVGSSNASELFVTSPEMYLSVPPVLRTSAPFGTYDSITSLPPVL